MVQLVETGIIFGDESSHHRGVGNNSIISISLAFSLSGWPTITDQNNPPTLTTDSTDWWGQKVEGASSPVI